jgi:hypothetical protein
MAIVNPPVRVAVDAVAFKVANLIHAGGQITHDFRIVAIAIEDDHPQRVILSDHHPSSSANHSAAGYLQYFSTS